MSKNNLHHLSMILAYLEIGKISAKANTELKNTSEFQNAIAYQLFHAIELFYKYMLLKKGITKKIHNLAILEEEYEKKFPLPEYKLDHPFDFSNYESYNGEEEQIAQEHLEKFKPKFMDQHLRYPNNQNTGGYSYQIEACIFEDMEKKIINLSK